MHQRFLMAAACSTWTTTPCSEYGGVSRWHLLALGILSDRDAKEFLVSTCTVEGAVLLEDLLEHTTDDIPGMILAASGFSIWSAALMPSCKGLSIEQICRRDGCTLLSHYWCVGSRRWKMHPIVMSFEDWIKKEIEREWGFSFHKSA